MNRKFIARWAGLLTAFGLIASTAFAQNTKTINFGLTRVKLSSTFTSALQSLDVTPGAVEPTRIDDGTAGFPIVGGAIDLDTAKGNLLHSGGLTLKANGIEVRLQSFIIDTTGGSPVITGLVVVGNKLVGRVPLFNLTLPAGLSLPLRPEYRFNLLVKDVGVTLTSQAAAALNQVYSVSAFTAGLDIGTADVYARLNRNGWHR